MASPSLGSVLKFSMLKKKEGPRSKVRIEGKRGSRQIPELFHHLFSLFRAGRCHRKSRQHGVVKHPHVGMVDYLAGQKLFELWVVEREPVGKDEILA